MPQNYLKLLAVSLCCLYSLAGCALYDGDDWPSLADRDPETASPDLSSPAPAPAQDGAREQVGAGKPGGAGIIPSAADLRAISAKLVQHRADFDRLRGATDELADNYQTAVGRLASDGSLADWNTAQVALSRLNARIFEIRRLSGLVADIVAQAAQIVASRRDIEPDAGPVDGNGFGKQLDYTIVQGGALYGRIRFAVTDYQATAIAAASRLDALRPDQDLQGVKDDSGNRRPLMVVRFSSVDVEFERDLRTAVTAARARYPDLEFEVMLVAPETGTPDDREAEDALKTTLRALIAMDVTPARVWRQKAAEVTVPEIRIFVR
ncbi:MAG: hypothetical protein ACE5EM_09215 [Sphingomonadales bacterium]